MFSKNDPQTQVTLTGKEKIRLKRKKTLNIEINVKTINIYPSDSAGILFMITQRAYFLCTQPLMQTMAIWLTITSYYYSSFTGTSVSIRVNRPNFMQEKDRRPCPQVGSRLTPIVPHYSPPLHAELLSHLSIIRDREQ